MPSCELMWQCPVEILSSSRVEDPTTRPPYVDKPSPMLRTGAEGPQRLLMLPGHVALVHSEGVVGVLVMHGRHDVVTRHLGDHRCRGDATSHPVPLPHGESGNSQSVDREAVG